MSNLCKSQHLKFYLRLKQQESIIEKSVEAFIVNIKVDTEVWHNIKRDIDKLEHERQNIVDSLKLKVTDIYGVLQSVREMINVENVDKIDLPNFKMKLQCLWKRIQEFKYLQDNINTLVEEQNSFNTDISTLTRVIRKHKNFSSTDHITIKAANSKGQSQKEESAKACDYDEVEDFCTLLAKTGHTGSWSEEDHLLFVKLRKKHKGVPGLVRAIQAKCPDLTKECIVNHEAWYKTYLELREKQKLAVQEWRKRKESERLAKVTAAASEAVAPEGSPVGISISSAEEAHRSSPSGEESLLKVAEHKKLEVERKKELVRRWKEQREKQRAAEEERLRNHLRARRTLKESQRRARASRLKNRVAEYKRSKAAQEVELRDDGDGASAEQAFLSALNLRFYRARDQEFLEKRRHVLSSKKNDPKQHVQPVEYNFARVSESTLLKETMAWQEKQKKIEPKTAQLVSYIKDLPKRAMVSWKSYEIPGSFTSRQR